jgi:hypothetical protein
MAELQDAPPRRVSMLEDPEPDADPEPSAAGTDAPVRPVSILSEPELTAAGPFDEAPRSPIEVTATYAGQDQTRPPPPRARHDSLLARIGTRIPEQTELAQESLHPAQPPQTSASQPNPGPVQAPGPAAPNPWLWRAAIALVLAAIGVVAIAVVISRSS